VIPAAGRDKQVAGKGETRVKQCSDNPVTRDKLRVQATIAEQQDNVGDDAERQDRIAELRRSGRR